ncbi:MAG: helix-turn-helix transcriptional regulator [Lachnospiraceae bacterium]|nr:helix-turn-helix transcriptional regulator [Lachnospiraceae bacterium]
MGLSERLKENRERLGLSQGDVAEKLNITRQSISRWETGKGAPDLDNLVLLSKLYQVSTDELLKEKGKRNEKSSQNNFYFRWCIISLFVGLVFLVINIIYFDMNWMGERDLLLYLKYWVIINPFLLHLVTVIPFVLSAIFLVKAKYKEEGDNNRNENNRNKG